MFDAQSIPGVRRKSSRFDRKLQAERRALQLYHRACSQDWLKQVWSALRGCSRHLLNLAETKAACAIGSYYVGKQTVRISQIRGSASESRSHDFDADFRPLKAHSQTRWVSVAAAWQLGVKLRPVQLVQVGEVYFVEDGHHRISVAKAMGHHEIEAVVTVWEVAGPLPWSEILPGMIS